MYHKYHYYLFMSQTSEIYPNNANQTVWKVNLAFAHAHARLSSSFTTWRSNVINPFWFLVCYAATQLATQLPQRRIQVVRSNKVAAGRKRLTESNGTPAMDFECEELRKRRYTQTKNRTKPFLTQAQQEFRWIKVSVCTIINFWQMINFIYWFVHSIFDYARNVFKL